MAGEVETAIADAKKALQEGGVERLNNAFNELQTVSHKLAEALYQQTARRQLRRRTSRSGVGGRCRQSRAGRWRR